MSDRTRTDAGEAGARQGVGSGTGDRGSRTLHVCVVCSGNICRSPIGEHLVRRAVADAGLADRVTVSSAGTGPWHVGQPAHRRAQSALQRAGFPVDHVARQIDRDLLAEVDLVLAADRTHVWALQEMADDVDGQERIALLRSFDPAADDQEIPDPYYGGDEGFDEVLGMVTTALPGIVAEIRRRLDET